MARLGRGLLDIGIELAQGGVVLQQVGGLLDTTYRNTQCSDPELHCFPFKQASQFASVLQDCLPESLMTVTSRRLFSRPSTHLRKLRPARKPMQRQSPLNHRFERMSCASLKLFRRVWSRTDAAEPVDGNLQLLLGGGDDPGAPDALHKPSHSVLRPADR